MAAFLAWQGSFPASVAIKVPAGNWLQIPVADAEAIPGGGRAGVIKDAGDDPDITHGVRVVAEVLVNETEDSIRFCAGEGIGTVTLPGLQIPVGEPAVNPVPRRMIEAALRSLLPAGHGAEITLSIPGGTELARRTLNPTLGIVGGLSVIGTTGIVEPMSEEAFKNSLQPQISVAKAQGYTSLVMVPGKIGQDFAIAHYGLPAACVVQTSNFIGFMLEAAVKQEIKKVLLFGHLGKLAKVAAGVFHTHNRMADARMETLAACLAIQGAPREAVAAVLDCRTTEGAIPIIAACGMNKVFDMVAQRASRRATRYVFDDLTVGTALVTMKGGLLGMDDNARQIGGELGWNIA